MSQTVKWGPYEFTVCDKDGNWNKLAGIYIFSGVSGGAWRPYYIGQTDDFSSRIPNHERWAEAARFGATHVHALVVQEAARRDAIEKDLIQKFQPRLNEQLK